MESRPEFRKVTRMKDGGQLLRIPKTFAGELPDVISFEEKT